MPWTDYSRALPKRWNSDYKNESAKRLSPDERQIGQMAPSTYCRFADHAGSDRLINTMG